MLVGHSYDGKVISTAAIGNDQVQALAYFNGWISDVGESQQQLLEKFEGSLVGPSIRPVPFTNPDGSEGTDLYLAPEAFREAFAADVDPETAAVMAAAQRPYAAAAFAATPVAPPAWNTLPCWYLLGTEDKAIPPELQRFMAGASRRDDRGGAGFARLVRVAARGRDPAHPAGGRSDRGSRLTCPSPAEMTRLSVAATRGHTRTPARGRQERAPTATFDSNPLPVRPLHSIRTLFRSDR